jgi:RHS repeat-associated protein
MESGAIDWAYDNADRLLSESTPQGVVSYTYNAASQRASMTAADRAPVNYTYDTAGRLATIAQGSETFTYAYDALSRVAPLNRPNGVRTNYAYDKVYRLARLTHTNSANQALEDFQYTYNSDDEIESINSLASATLLPTAKTAAPADAANRLPQFGTASYTFDNEGQTTTRNDAPTVTNLTWDARGRLTRATLSNGQTVDYGYDALGRRNSRTASNATTTFLYDRHDVVLDRATDNTTTEYLNGLGIDDKLRQTNSLGETNHYFLQDHLGSTSVLTDATGNVAERESYESFGASSQNSITGYGFTGREHDATTRTLYYRARWYEPYQARFISEDGLGFAGGLNSYSYVSNNPLRFTDPGGTNARLISYLIIRIVISLIKPFDYEGHIQRGGPPTQEQQMPARPRQERPAGSSSPDGENPGGNPRMCKPSGARPGMPPDPPNSPANQAPPEPPKPPEPFPGSNPIPIWAFRYGPVVVFIVTVFYPSPAY